MPLSHYQSRQGTPKSGRLNHLKMTDGEPNRLASGLILHGIRDISKPAKIAVPKAFSYLNIPDAPDKDKAVNALNAGKQYDIKPFRYEHFDNSDSDAFQLDAYYDLTDADMHNLSDDHHLIVSLLDVLSISESGAAMVDLAARSGWSISFSTSDTSDYEYDIATKTITLITGGMSADSVMRSAYFSNHMVLSLIHGLRDAWHEKQSGSLCNFYDAQSVFLLERLRMADIDVVAVMVAHELAKNGDGGVWRHIMTTDCHDIAYVYQSSVNAYGRDDAMKDAFYQWFDNDERTSGADHDILNYLDDMLASSVSEYTLSGLKTMNAHVIERLSTLPDKSRYLAGQGRNILSNTQFMQIRDPLNRRHYDQIMRDTNVTFAGGVAFRDKSLASKLFPNVVIEAL